MRTASKISALAVLLGGLALFGGPASAADAPPAFSPPPAISAPPAVPANTVVAAAAPSLSNPSPTPPVPPVPSDPKIAAAAGNSPAGNGPSGNLNTLENKVPDSVKEIVKHLDKTTEDVTLDDLNSARQAVAKIEALIEIEKHLAELEKVRQERDKRPSFAGAIPASALQPPSMPVGMMPSYSAGGMTAGAMPVVMAERALEVSRIMGRNGHYSAVLKMSDDKTRTVQVGDHLPDGNVVLGITATDVELGRGVSRQSLHIKNVDTVFGSSS